MCGTPRATLEDGGRHFWVLLIEGKGGVTGTWWVKARHTAQHPTVHSTTPTAENDPAPDIRGALVRTTDQGGYFGTGSREVLRIDSC